MSCSNHPRSSELHRHSAEREETTKLMGNAIQTTPKRPHKHEYIVFYLHRLLQYIDKKKDIQ